MRSEVLSEERSDIGHLHVQRLYLLSDAEIQQFRRLGLSTRAPGEHVLTEVHQIVSPSASAVRGQRVKRTRRGALLHQDGPLDPGRIDLDQIWTWVDAGPDRPVWTRDDGETFPAFAYVPTRHRREADGAPEYLDPQWERETFTRDPDVERERVGERKLGWLNAQLDAGLAERAEGQWRRGERGWIRPVQSTNVTDQVAASADDAREADDGSSFSSSAGINQSNANPTASLRYNSGHRFASLAIPNAATIDDSDWAGDQFSTASDDYAALLHLEDVDDAADFSTTADVTSRARTSASVSLIEDGVGTGFVWISTVGSATDLNGPLQEVVDRGGFTDSSAIVVLILGNDDSTKTLWFNAYDLDTAKAAKIDVDYTSGPAIPVMRHHYEMMRGA